MKKKKRKKKNKKIGVGALWKGLGGLAGIVFFITIVFSTLYCFSIAPKIEKRFSGRRWNIPSKVFSDITLLYPQQNIERTFFDKKLRRLGYREVPHTPARKGEMRISKDFIELFLHDLKVPSHARSGFPVRISLKENQIASIKALENEMPVPLLELEPEELMLFYGPDHERRQVVSLKNIPVHLKYAVLAAEDKRFYRHFGFDPWGILRAFYTNLRRGGIVAGGSTITQQLAKCYFLSPQRTFGRKLKELFTAITMEAMYDKDDILEIYLNEIYFGQNGSVAIHGIAEAAAFYFAKSVSELSPVEAATLAGLIKAPNRYSPHVNIERCRSRRNTVLRAMHKNQWLSDARLRNGLVSQVKVAEYTVYKKKAPYFIDYLTEQLEMLYSPEVLTTEGLSIFTTLDTQVQTAAEQALQKGLTDLEKLHPEFNGLDPQKRLQGAIIVLQPRSGAILALVGGRNYSESQFNRISQARRQPGSAFKPFVYLSGLDKFTTTSMLSNAPKSYSQNGNLWEPQNFAPIPSLQVTLRRALAQSINLATVDLAIRTGLDLIVETSSAFGFSTTLKPYPSLALGAFEVIPLELARAYCAFAADGVLPYLLSIKDILDENSNIIERRHITLENATSPAKAFIINSLLRSVVTDGTARSLKNMGLLFPAAGKTGTTNDYRDAWFVGYTPDILALVWIGCDAGSSIEITGASAALPVWGELMKSIPQYITGKWFKLPPGAAQRTLCADSSRLFVDNACPKAIEEYFLVDNIPALYCTMHQKTGILKRFLKGVNDFFKKL